MPETRPRTFLTGHCTTLLRVGLVPSVPRSTCRPYTHKLACSALLLSVSPPATIPRSLMLVPKALAVGVLFGSLSTLTRYVGCSADAANQGCAIATQLAA